MTITLGAAPPAFRIGRIFTHALRLIGANILPYAVLALLAFLPNLALNIVINGTADISGMFWAQSALQLIFGQLLTAIISYGVFQHLRGQRTSLAACLRFGLRRWAALIGVAFVSSWIIGLYTLLLIVPGIMKATALWVIVPVCVIEGLGGSDCRQRSEQLTAGYRWHIFGLLAITAVLTIIWSAGLNIVYGITDQDTGPKPIGFLIADYAGDALTAVLSSVLTTVGYFALRQIKDGIDLDEIAAIFD